MITCRRRFLVEGAYGVYHVMSRTSCGQFLFDREAKAAFVRILRRQAGFAGLDVLAYCVMGNHFHLLVGVPAGASGASRELISDRELLRRYRLLYADENCPASSTSPTVLAKLLASGSEEGREQRARILARMHDLPAFMRELKQRFGLWYNHRYDNRGTIWAARFRSVIVERCPEALSTVAAYIDLNPVRARLVGDPADYAASSFGAATRGAEEARAGYAAVFCRTPGEVDWATLRGDYSLILYGKGRRSKGVAGKDQGVIGAEASPEPSPGPSPGPSPIPAGAATGPNRPTTLAAALRRRVRYFSAGSAIGSSSFLRGLSPGDAARPDRDRAHRMRGGPWGSLRSYRDLKVQPVGADSADSAHSVRSARSARSAWGQAPP